MRCDFVLGNAHRRGYPNPIVCAESGIRGHDPVSFTEDLDPAHCWIGRAVVGANTYHVQVGLQRDRSRGGRIQRCGNVDADVPGGISTRGEVLSARPIGDPFGDCGLLSGRPGDFSNAREVGP